MASHIVSANRVGVDPITTEVIRNAFVSIAEEMNASLIRSAYSQIIFEAGDSVVVLIDAEHNVLGQSSGIPLFLGTIEECLPITEERFGRDVWNPGDVWVLNDSYLTGGHLNDFTVYAPLYHRGELAGFTASRVHHMDIGAKDPGGTTDASDIYQEGLRMGPLKLVEGGRVREDVVDVLTRNSRLRYQMGGDLRAQIAVSRVGEARLSALLDRYGRETVAAARDEIFRQTEALDRSAVAAMPDGVYKAEGYIDNDGITDRSYFVPVEVRVEGDRLTVDLTGADDQAQGPINSGEPMVVSACRLALKRVMNPEQPVNGGSFRPLDVKVREGSFLAAREPAPCWYYYSALGLMVDLISTALAPAMPEASAAAHYGDSCTMLWAGTDPRTGRLFVDMQEHAGGWGAWKGSDGESVLICASVSQLKNEPIEVIETKNPLRINRYAMRRDSAGAGRWRGGAGVVREYVIEGDNTTVTAWFERSKTPAWGIFGGKAGSPPSVVVNPGREDERRFLKSNALPLKRGDVVVAMTGGGGGYGDPREREPELVRRDVQDGVLSPERALSDYGVWVEGARAGS